MNGTLNENIQNMARFLKGKIHFKAIFHFIFSVFFGPAAIPMPRGALSLIYKAWSTEQSSSFKSSASWVCQSFLWTGHLAQARSIWAGTQSACLQLCLLACGQTPNAACQCISPEEAVKSMSPGVKVWSKTQHDSFWIIVEYLAPLLTSLCGVQ